MYRRAFFAPILGAPLGPAFPPARGFFCAWKKRQEQLEGGWYQKKLNDPGTIADRLGK
jgi:hypothetical protein